MDNETNDTAELNQQPESKPEDKPDFDPTQTREFKGLLADKQRETVARQEAESRAAGLERQLKELGEKMEKSSQSGDNFPDLADDDLMTKGDIMKLIARTRDEIRTEREKEVQRERELYVDRAGEQAKKTYTVEKYGEGLDFDSVIRDGTLPLVRDNPELGKAIQHASNPAEFAYQVGKTHPAVDKRLRERANAQLVKDLQKNVRSKETGDLSMLQNVSQQASTFEELMKKSDEELLAEIQAAE